MVVDEMSDAEVDRLFQAFADKTRRDIVAKVTVGEQSVSELAAHYAMSFAAVQKHVAVLERADVITKHKRGREQIVRVRLETIAHARALLDTYEEIWRQRVDRIDDLLSEDPKG
ncbi:transcriptional regulator [Rhodococcus sp. 05-340-1]|jgi:DNA-binding transcriptional ArsR family regulator|uniref:ArsR/SmtB family transcription factor n=1 Tax=unclassified Rhodococcus (in: high G+C Gram-positive bacteria) TaxID=192944 RepID=UPI000B9B5CE0|nr:MULTISPECIES: metalloregulator ArsR/SmtB family transcription factor [unclassified Rhodococcus (in: high G+C Gram-positive bacteria)]OZD64329.1 transcriptional regulator [Rhodococcus sp. 05-340-2]OZD76590.1 transcriptional regulator [Rhodococcus sp. 05-340-1]